MNINRNNTNLSRLINSILNKLTLKKTKLEISPNVEKLMGTFDLPKEVDCEKVKEEHLRKKYIHDGGSY